MDKYMCCFAHKEPYVPHETMIERIVKSTSSSSNVHGVIDDNHNSYMNMVMDVMRMNQSYTDKFSIIDEKFNTDATRFFDLLKDYDEP
jgi:hypothetical protein